jgi:hypothetical protein
MGNLTTDATPNAQRPTPRAPTATCLTHQGLGKARPTGPTFITKTFSGTPSTRRRCSSRISSAMLARVNHGTRSALTLTAQTPIPRYDFVGPDRSAGLGIRSPGDTHPGRRGFLQRGPSAARRSVIGNEKRCVDLSCVPSLRVGFSLAENLPPVVVAHFVGNAFSHVAEVRARSGHGIGPRTHCGH